MTDWTKVLVWFLVFAAFLPLASQSKKPGASPNRDQEAVNTIKRLEDELRMASLKGNAGWWSDYLTDTYVETDGRGAVIGKTEVVAMHRSPDLVIETLNLSDRNVQTFNGDTVVITGRMTLVGTYRDENLSGDYQFTRVWVKLGLEWKLAASQTSALVH